MPINMTISTELMLCFALWASPCVLFSNGSWAVCETQIFTVPCLSSKHPFYMTHLFNYASFHRDKNESRPSCEHFSTKQLYSPNGFDSKQAERTSGPTYDIC